MSSSAAPIAYPVISCAFVLAYTKASIAAKQHTNVYTGAYSVRAMNPNLVVHCTFSYFW